MNKILNTLVESGAILEGHFLLTSGLHSNKYIEKFRLIEKPESLDFVCSSMANLYKDKNINVVLGAAVGGILISGGVGQKLNVKHIFTERVNGIMELRRGFSLDKNSKVLIVEDIITTGGSVFELVKLAEFYKAEIVGIVSLIHRSKEKINFGHNYRTLLEFPVDSWDECDIPDWLSNIEITKPGSTGK